MYQSLVTRVQRNGIDWLSHELQKAWLESHEREIECKAKTKLDQERKKISEKYSQLYKQQAFENYSLADPTKNGIYVKQSGKKLGDQPSIEKQKTDFLKKQEQLNALNYQNYYTEIEAEFIQKFYKWWEDENFKQKCNQQIEQLDLKKVLDKFFVRHSWLKKQQSNYVAQKFLESFLKDRLNDGLKIFSNRSNLFSATLSCEIDEDQLKKMIEGYPFSETRFLIGLSYPDTLSTQQDDGKPLLNHVLKRIDAICFLYNSCTNEGLGICRQDGVFIPKYAAFHINEFEHFSESQWSYFKILLINISTESDPYWVLLNKEEGKWVAYVEQNNPIKLEVTQIFQEYCIRIEQVNSEYNYYPSDIDNLTAKTKWHAVLFGRVFPACYNKSPVAVENYRSHVSVSLLLQDTFAKCVKNNPQKTNNINRAFINRKPFSNLTVDKALPIAKESWNGKNLSFKNSTIDELNQSRYGNERIALLLNTWNDLEIDSTQNILNKFDKGVFNLNYEKNITTLNIESKINNASELIEALQVVYHSKVSELVLSCEEDLPRSQKFSIVEQLFDYDIYLRSVLLLEDNANYLANFSKPLHCAARNRFLANYSPNTLETADNVKIRKRLWDITGEKITHFFANKDVEFDLDFIKEVSSFNKEWRHNFCDDNSKTKLKALLGPSAWSFVQIAQMGEEGLTSFFSHIKRYYYATFWEPVDPKPAANLYCTFDLNGGLSDVPELYIDFLTAKIKSLELTKSKCSPLFKSLSFIMPEKLSDKAQDAFLNLLSELNDHKQHLPEEIDKVVLYDLEINSKDTIEILEKLKSMADEELQVLIELPEWDRNTYEKNELRKIKATYRQIQNKILDNQRCLRQLVLKENTQLIHDCAKNVLKSDVIIEDKLTQKEQDWTGDDVRYPLAAQYQGFNSNYNKR